MLHKGIRSASRARLAAHLGLAAGLVALAATPALATAALPRTYDVTPIQAVPPFPGGGGNFGWGITSADLNKDGKMEVLVAESQQQDRRIPGKVFIYDGATSQHLDTLTAPEENPETPTGDPPVLLPNPGEAFAFVYVEQVADLGSCPGGVPGGANEICPNRIGDRDGVPEIVAGSRALRVGTPSGDCPAPATTSCPTLGRTGNIADPIVGRAYVFDGATRAVLKRIDMPLAHRQSQVARGGAGTSNTSNTSPDFGRYVQSAQGLAPCAGLAAEGNNAGVGPCDVHGPEQNKPSVRIGDVDGIANDNPAGGRADLFISARNYRETSTPGLVNSAAGGSQCAAAFGTPLAVGPTSTSGNCQGGKVFMYRGEEISGTSPAEILDGIVNGQTTDGSAGLEGAKETVRELKDPFTQLPGQEFSGAIQRIGDVARCPGGAGTGPAHRCAGVSASNFLPDGKPEIVVLDDQIDGPSFTNPDASWQDVGAAHLFDGATGLLLYTYPHPEPKPQGHYADTFNPGWPAGNIGHSDLPDLVSGASSQSVQYHCQGRGYIYNGDAVNNRGAEVGMLDDPTPAPSGQFGSSYTGVGDLVRTPGTPNNEVMMGSYAPFSCSDEATASLINDVTIFNGVTNTPLQRIPDPVQERGSAFGMGMAPMGDLNGDGFLDFAITSYLSNLPGVPGAGRAYIFRSNNRPLPPPSNPGPTVSRARILRPGNCTNDLVGTARADVLNGTTAGDRIFGFGGADRAQGFQSADCLDGGTGSDRLAGGIDRDRLIGRSGNDRLSGGNDRDRLFGGSGRDRLRGGYGADVLGGGSGRDRLDGGPETDRVYGEGGDDRIRSGGGRNILDGGRGDDRIFARNHRRDVITCGSGDDVVSADRTDIVKVDCEVIRRPR